MAVSTRVRIVGVLGWLIILFCGAAFAVDIPKEGSFEFDFCFVSQAETMTADKQLTITQFTVAVADDIAAHYPRM